MSWDILLLNPEDDYTPYELPEAHNGGSFDCLGGCLITDINVTYNYSWYYYKYLDKEKGIRVLHEMIAKDTIPLLEKAIEPFKEMPPYPKDYWADTPGNCVKILKIFLEWAILFPNGKWEVY